MELHENDRGNGGAKLRPERSSVSDMKNDETLVRDVARYRTRNN